MSRLAVLLLAVPLFWLPYGGLAARAAAADTPALVRLGNPVDGHIHPAACITPKGTLVVTFGQVNHRDLRITRSTDGGGTWSQPAPFPHTVGKTYYPGSLTTLADGRIMHAWNRWSGETNETEPRSVLYSISSDEGATWSVPAPMPRDEKTMSVIRHPLVELAPNRWLVSLSDRTFVLDPTTGVAESFGDGRNHGLVPIVRTPRGTFVSGAGLRSTDAGKTWSEIPKFPNLKEQGWRHELVCLRNGWLLASEILGPGVGGERIRYVVSRDDGQTWSETYEYYAPGRPIGGRACPRTVQLDEHSIGVVFYDVERKQEGGPALYFLKIPLAKFSAPKPAEPSAAVTKLRPLAGLPALGGDVVLGKCSAAAAGRDGQVFLLHRGRRPLLCVDGGGRLVRSWGDDVITTPHGLRVDAAGHVWVTDIGSHRVLKFDSTGKLLLTLGTGRAGEGDDEFNQPTDVAFGPNGEFFVTDGYGNSRVLKFSAAGRLLKKWGVKGKGEGEFALPHAALVDARGRLLVGDRENNRIQLFDLDGRFLEQWPGPAPYGLAMNRAGEVFVADGRANQVMRLDERGRVAERWGEKGNAAAQFDLPHMLTFDAAGRLWVAEVGNQRFQVFDVSGGAP